MKHFVKFYKVINIIVVISIFLIQIVCTLRCYLSVGPYDWNFLGCLPTGNVSPFMFTFVILLLFLPKRANEYFKTLITLLSVGMFLSPTLSCIYNAYRNYAFHWYLALDYIAHYLLFLFGIYIVKTNQVELNVKNAIKGGSIIIVVAIIMVILNAIFDTSFFGLSLNGKHNIYSMVLTSNSYLSACIYFFGLIAEMVLSFGLVKLLNSKN